MADLAKGQSNPVIETVLRQIAAANLLETVTHLSSYHTRLSTSEEAVTAETWIASEMIRYGFQVRNRAALTLRRVQPIASLLLYGMEMWSCAPCSMCHCRLDFLTVYISLTTLTGCGSRWRPFRLEKTDSTPPM